MDLDFDVYDCAYLKISPTKGVMIFGKNGKLNCSFVDSDEILRHVSKITYELDLPIGFPWFIW